MTIAAVLSRVRAPEIGARAGSAATIPAVRHVPLPARLESCISHSAGHGQAEEEVGGAVVTVFIAADNPRALTDRALREQPIRLAGAWRGFDGDRKSVV
jgi:hypothetical protein